MQSEFMSDGGKKNLRITPIRNNNQPTWTIHSPMNFNMQENELPLAFGS